MQAQKTALQAQKIAQKMVSTIQGHAKLWIERVRAYAQALYYRIDEHHLFMFSSGLAFSLLLCIIPLVLIIFFVLGNVLDSAAVRAQLNFFIDSSIPDTSTADFVKALVNTRVQEVVASKKIAGWVGGFGLLFAASGWFTGMRTVLNLIYQVKNAASTVRGKLKDLGMVLFVVLLFVVSLTFLPAIDLLKNLAEQLPIAGQIEVGALQGRMLQLLSLLGFGCVNFIIFLLIPDQNPPRRAVLMSALWATILQELSRQAFSYYLLEFSTWGKIYGAYAVMVIVAFWLYFSALIMLVAAEIGQIYRERRQAAETSPQK